MNQIKTSEGIKSYTIKGRVIDIITKSPIKDVKVILKYSNNDIIIDSYTNNEGSYELNFEIDLKTLEDQNIELNFIPKNDSSQIQYEIGSYIPLTSDRNIKHEIPPQELKIKNTNQIEESISEFSKIPDEIISQIKNGLKVDGDWTKNFFKGISKNVFLNLIPAVSNLLLNFGIKNINGKKDKCPSQDNIINIARKRNNIVRNLNSIYNSLNVVLQASSTNLTLMNTLKKAKDVQVNLPTPIIEYSPHSLIHIKQEVIKKFQKEFDKMEGMNLTILMYVTILRELIRLLLSYLRVLDNNIKDCYDEIINDPDNPLGFESYIDPLLEELRNIDNPKNDQEQFSFKTYHNGFEIRIINIENNKIGGLFRKQAVALNSQGVIVLRGEESFSSSEDILKNELIFYININNLKAY